MKLSDLPLYATDADIAAAVLGKSGAKDWDALAMLWERKGLPKKDELTGKRYTPAVRTFFDMLHGLTPQGAVKAPDGVDGVWGERKQGARR